MTRQLAHEPAGLAPDHVAGDRAALPVYRVWAVWRQDTTAAAEARAKIFRGGVRWGAGGLVCQHLTVARVAEGLAVSWNTAKAAGLAEGRRLLISDPGQFEGVQVVGVDEHVVWRHTRLGDKYVTVIIDLTPIRDGTRPRG